MYIGFTQDRNEFLKIKRLENYQGNYYENTNLPNLDKKRVIYLWRFISLLSVHYFFILHSILYQYSINALNFYYSHNYYGI